MQLSHLSLSAPVRGVALPEPPRETLDVAQNALAELKARVPAQRTVPEHPERVLGRRSHGLTAFRGGIHGLEGNGVSRGDSRLEIFSRGLILRCLVLVSSAIARRWLIHHIIIVIVVLLRQV